MNRPEPDSPEARKRSRAAAEWLALQDRGLTAAEQDRFLDWLSADPLHSDWLALHRSTTGDLVGLTNWRPNFSTEPNPDLLAPPRRRTPWLVLGSLAAAAALAVSFTLRLPLAQPPPADVVAYERRILEDGSAVELNRGASVSVVYSSGERRARLSSGEALFTVTSDPTRPFVVEAGGFAIRAVGTAFTVRLSDAFVEVLVTDGRVAFGPRLPTPGPSTSGDARASEDADAGLATVLVDAGHRATAERESLVPPAIAAVTPAEVARALAWQPQLLDFSSVPLRLALAEFNRRNRLQFVLVDPEIGDLPIVASIRSDNTEGFARFLERTPGLTVVRTGADEILVRRRR